MKIDLLVYNARIVTQTEVFDGYLSVVNGKIFHVDTGDPPSLDATEVVDARGKLLLPGAIDTHPHFFEPGAEQREDFTHGTSAAASGGFTTVLDMPNTPTDPVLDPPSFTRKLERATCECMVDFAFWGSATPKNRQDMAQLNQLGCIGYKAFTIDSDPAFPWSDEYDQWKEMEEVARFNGIFAAHAENADIVQRFTEENLEQPWSLAVHDASRPWLAELTAIHTLLLYAKLTGCKLHICHMSIPEGAQLIQVARREGVDVTVETCAHYLTLNVQDNAVLGTFAKINPPLRSRDRMERLWEFVLDGTIDYLGTDHAPYLEEDKMPANGDARQAACGAPEIDLAIPLLLEEGVKKRGMSLCRFAAFTATNAAKRFGLYPRKGAIEPGADADFYLVDENSPWIYSRKNSFSKSKVARFAQEGRLLQNKICATYVRGKAVYANGKILQKPGFGRYVLPQW